MQVSTFSASYDAARPIKPVPHSQLRSHLQGEKADNFSQYTAYHHAQGRHARQKLVRVRVMSEWPQTFCRGCLESVFRPSGVLRKLGKAVKQNIEFYCLYYGAWSVMLTMVHVVREKKCEKIEILGTVRSHGHRSSGYYSAREASTKCQ